MIVFDGLKLIGLAIMTAPLLICVIVNIIDRIIDRITYAVKKRQQKRIDESFKEESE